MIRSASPDDLAAIHAIQAACPEAARWNVRDYLQYDCFVNDAGGIVAGFAVCRRISEDESELLNLAVDPNFRRRGIGRDLIAACTAGRPGKLWLEVRESNTSARRFYLALGFTECGRRANYYSTDDEAAIVMNFHS